MLPFSNYRSDKNDEAPLGRPCWNEHSPTGATNVVAFGTAFSAGFQPLYYKSLCTVCAGISCSKRFTDNCILDAHSFKSPITLSMVAEDGQMLGVCRLFTLDHALVSSHHSQPSRENYPSVLHKFNSNNAKFMTKSAPHSKQIKYLDVSHSNYWDKLPVEQVIKCFLIAIGI